MIYFVLIVFIYQFSFYHCTIYVCIDPKIIFSISCKFLQKCWFDLLQVVLMIYKEKKKKSIKMKNFEGISSNVKNDKTSNSQFKDAYIFENKTFMSI